MEKVRAMVVTGGVALAVLVGGWSLLAQGEKKPIDDKAKGDLVRLLRQELAELRKTQGEKHGLARGVGVLPVEVPAGLHDGVRLAVADWATEIPRQLANHKVRVVPPRRVKALKETKDPIAAGKALNVSMVLVIKLNVEEDNASMRIEAELLDVAEDMLLWKAEFKHEDILTKMKFLEETCFKLATGVTQRLTGEN
jgi:TolB-like protein